ncbi:MAG: hypothetical protein JO352_30090 [Chloroflexi bacterium]|nr:hypothetical protein [Chloroflexota bacterium]MBV9599078.1 hypothetical protein [Chloroflexota bacterium]
MSEETFRSRPDPSSTSPVVERRPISPGPADARTYRATQEVHAYETAPGFVLARPHLHWGPIIAGLLTALTTMFLLSLLGGGIGLAQFNAATAAAQGGVPGDAARNSAIWAGFSGILSFLLGGYVAARLAHMLDRNWGAWHGALVFMLALPIALWLAGQGLGTLLGTVGNVASGLNVGAGQAASAAQNASAQAQANPVAVGQAAEAIRNTMWGALVGSLLALGASALGGWLGAHHLLSLTDDRPLAR